jgi:glycosyltransferase involved in cell wall biosynthesis
VRILIDYRPALRQRTGVGEYVHQLARALAEQRIDRSMERRAGDRRAGTNTDSVELFTSSWKDRPTPEAAADLGEAIRIVDRRIPVRLLNAAWQRFDWPPVEWLTGHYYDVVHSPNPLLIASRCAARVVTIHDLDFLLHPERTHAEMRHTYPALVRRHAATADAVIAGCHHVAEQVVNLLHVEPARVHVCTYGVPRWTAREPLVPGNPTGHYILFLGTLEPRKNVGALLDAYEILLGGAMAASLPDLVLAGRATPDAQPWLDRIARAPLAGRVRHLGYVNPDARRRVYDGATLLVQPSFEEGFGMPVLEAMTLGVPVVAANRGSLPEVLDDAGLLVEPEPEAFAAAIARMLSDPSFRIACSAAGVRRARHFNWMTTAARVYDTYQRALASRASRHRAPSLASVRPV